MFAGIYPIDSSDFDTLKDALGRLQLNDSALTIEQESSHSLGFGFRCGFLGLLHLEIIFERISREFDLDIIATAPSVIYKVVLKNGKHYLSTIQQPTQTPPLLEHMEEPWVRCEYHYSSRVFKQHHELMYGQTRGLPEDGYA